MYFKRQILLNTPGLKQGPIIRLQLPDKVLLSGAALKSRPSDTAVMKIRLLNIFSLKRRRFKAGLELSGDGWRTGVVGVRGRWSSSMHLQVLPGGLEPLTSCGQDARGPACMG